MQFYREIYLYALFNLRFESFRFVRGQFSVTQCQICLPQLGIKEKKKRVGGNRQKVVSKQTKKLCLCHCMPLNGEIIIVPDIYLRFLSYSLSCKKDLSFSYRSSLYRLSSTTKNEIPGRSHIFRIDK